METFEERLEHYINVVDRVLEYLDSPEESANPIDFALIALPWGFPNRWRLCSQRIVKLRNELARDVESAETMSREALSAEDQIVRAAQLLFRALDELPILLMQGGADDEEGPEGWKALSDTDEHLRESLTEQDRLAYVLYWHWARRPELFHSQKTLLARVRNYAAHVLAEARESKGRDSPEGRQAQSAVTEKRPKGREEKRPPGRPRVVETAKDREIMREWATGDYSSYKALALELGVSKEHVKRVVARTKRRESRARQKARDK